MSGWHELFKLQVHKGIIQEWRPHPCAVLSPAHLRRLEEASKGSISASALFPTLSLILQLHTTAVCLNVPCEVGRVCNFPQFILLIYILPNGAFLFPSSS